MGVIPVCPFAGRSPEREAVVVCGEGEGTQTLPGSGVGIQPQEKKEGGQPAPGEAGAGEEITEKHRRAERTAAKKAAGAQAVGLFGSLTRASLELR
jgi:hypothetical protein